MNLVESPKVRETNQRTQYQDNSLPFQFCRELLVDTKRCVSILADHDMFDNNGSKMGEKDWKHVQASIFGLNLMSHSIRCDLSIARHEFKMGTICERFRPKHYR